ncbi:MAG: hypothetical protein KF784_09355 [Fimbriimonadaceae bacterium]|nr:hypothetical protein [Fimbriimonadaceae bacterium]
MLTTLLLGATLLRQDTFQGVVVEDRGGCKVISTTIDGVDLRAFLPGDTQAGDRISGVVLEADGSTLKPSTKYIITNSAGLGEPTRMGSGFTIGWAIRTTDNKPVVTGSILARLDGAIVCPAPSNYSSSAMVPRGTAIAVSGPFDGDVKSTKASTVLGPMTVVAESPRSCYVLPPGLMTGKFKFNIQEGSQAAVQCETRVVTPLFSIEDPLIKVGESTQANIGLLGLSDIQSETIPMVLTNNSPSIVSLKGGNTQVIEVNKSKLDANGAFRIEVPVTAIGAGRYELSLQTAMKSSVSDPDDEPDPIVVKVTGPSKIKANESATFSATCFPQGKVPVLVRFVYVSLRGFMRDLGTDFDMSDGFSAQLNASQLPEGPGFVLAAAITGEQNSATDGIAVTIGSDDPPVSFGNGDVQREYTRAARNTMTTTSSMIMATFNQVVQYESAIDEWNRKATEQWLREAEERSKAREALKQASNLEALDAELDRLMGTGFFEMDKLIKELEKIKASPGGAANKDDLKKQANEVEAAAKKCKEDCDALQKALDKAKQDQKDIEKQMTDLAADVQATFLADGWTGRATFDAGVGIIRWGFVHDGPNQINNFGSPQSQKINDARRKKRDLAKKLADKKKEIEDLEAKVKACKEHCAEMEEAAKKAQVAAANAQAAEVKESEIDVLCHKFREILERIRSYIEGRANLRSRLERFFQALTQHCPKTSKDLQLYANQIRDLANAKMQLEEELKKAAEQHRQNAKAAKDAAEAAQGTADQLAEQQRQAEETARKLAADRARQQAETERKARQAAAEAQKAQAERQAKEAEERAKAFDDWLKDMMGKGLISGDGEKLIEDLKDSLGAGIDISGSIAEGFAEALHQWMMNSSSGQTTAAGAAQALVGLAATIYYWWIEAEMRGAIDRIKEKLEPGRLQELLVTIGQNFNRQPFGRVDIPMKGNESFFFMRKGNMIIIFKAERGKGLTICYVGRAGGQLTMRIA